MQTALKEQHENWKVRHQRLFGQKQKPVLTPDPVIVIADESPSPKAVPMWTWAEMHFDMHVQAWQEMTRGATISELAHQNAVMRAALRVAEMDDELISKERRPIKEIVAEILRDFPGIEWVDIQSRHRTRDIIYPRHLCMHAITIQRPDLSYPQIGRQFGGRDHTTIIYGVKKIAEMTADEHRRELALQRKYCKKRRKYARERIRELEALAAE